MKSNETPTITTVVQRDFPQMQENHPSSRRVLVVDDEPLIRWSLAEVLGDLHYAVTEAGDGTAALKALSESDAFDVVVLDFHLPDSSDLSLLARLRQLRPTVPIIVMTAYGTPETVQGALDLGAYQVVIKPFELPELARLVARAYDDGKVG